jgi:hypothetical protein
MKTKLLVTLFLACAVLLTAAAPARADEPLPTQLEYVDAQLDIFRPLLADYQASYLSENGEYYQALGSHSVIPSGADGADLLDNHPTDQDTTLAPLWDSTGLPTEIAWSFQINVCAGSEGQGYILVVSTVVEDATWQRSDHAGYCGESEPWHIVEE